MQKRESKSGAWAGPLTADTGDEGIGVTLSKSMWMHQIQDLLQEDASLKLRVVTAGCWLRPPHLRLKYVSWWELVQCISTQSSGCFLPL